MQLSVKFAHERHESRYSSNPGFADEAVAVPETVLCPHKIITVICFVLFGWVFQRSVEKIQKNDCEKLRLLMNNYSTVPVIIKYA